MKYRMTGYRDASSMYLQQRVCFSVEFSKNILNEYLSLIEDDGVTRRPVELNLVRMNIDFGIDGAMQMYHDGTPKSMQLSLIFQERRPLRKEVTDADIPPSEAPPKVQDNRASQPTNRVDAGIKMIRKDLRPFVDDSKPAEALKSAGRAVGRVITGAGNAVVDKLRVGPDSKTIHAKELK
jgi:hypothetical protein